jgi:hypothetical protein
MVDPAIEDAIYYLLEFQIAGGAHDGAWALFDRGSSGAGADVGDVGVTAQAVLGLEPYRNTTLSTPTDLPLGTVENALSDAITYLQAVMPSGAVEHALRLLALLAVGASTQADLDNLVDLAPDGNFGSVFATALAARAIRAASSEYPFDSDGDGVADVTDPDDDDDGFPDATDAFPLDNAWHTDTDNDGLADEDPNETDVDGDGVADGVEPGFANDAQESMDSDSDGTGNVADDQDDHDGLTDVEELLIGLDPRDEDTDNDSFRDKAEVNAGKDGRDPTDYPLPDGDIYPLGSPDGITDLRDVLFAFRIVRGDLTGEGQPFFMRHADVAPLGAGGSPAPDGQFGPGDALVILRRVTGEIAVW